jgi:CRISPR system Cascade subunit CasD
VSTLLLRLSGPMQSWGTDSRFDIRFSGREPSKSGVIGLLCAALGKPRQEQPGDGLPALAGLSRLRMGVRVDRPGTLQVDYQTAGGSHLRGERYGVINAAGKSLSTVQSRRYYLADAEFVVALEGEDPGLMRRLDEALATPVWQLFLGRKAFVPGEPVRPPDTGPESPWWAMSFEQALREFPWRRRRATDVPPELLRVVLDTTPSHPDRELRQDLPIDFALRRFGPRYIRTGFFEPRLEVNHVSFPPQPEPAQPAGAN